MTGFVVRSYGAPDSTGLTRRCLHAFFYDPRFSVEDIDDAVLTELSRGSLFDQLIFSGYPGVIEVVAELLLEDNALRKRLLRSTGDIVRAVRIIRFDASKARHASRLIDGSGDLEEEATIRLHRAFFLTQAFTDANGLMTAPRGYHYRKPSGAHSSSFVRTSNVLENGHLIEVLAFWLLPYASASMRTVVVDTSGIAAVAVSFSHHAASLGMIERPAIIRSHSSYEGLSSLEVADPDGTVFLVSASTSGHLRGLLLDKGALPDQIITLYYLGHSLPAQNTVLCILNDNLLGKSAGLSPINNFSEADCPFCAERSCPVTIEGDQFSLEPPTIETLVISKEDIPRSQLEPLDRLAGLGVFKAYRAVDDADFEIFLDISCLFPSSRPPSSLSATVTDDVRERWQQAVKRGLAVHVNRIVYAAYPLSDILAQNAVGLLTEFQEANVELISASALRESKPTPLTAALVVSACVADATSLMAINRDLRDKQPRGNTCYATPVFRFSSREERDRIVSNLTYGESGPGTYSFFRLLEVELPKCSSHHSWRAELGLLRRMTAWLDREGKECPREVTERVLLLEAAPARGLGDELFWPSLLGKAIHLRSDFAFFTADPGRSISQADVFVVISAALHRLREGVSGKRRLIYRAYERAVISPDNFMRFNDGVIQAAILRASRDYDLAYANCDIAISNQLWRLVASQISHWSNEEGEALPEFMVALMCRRLTLYPQHEHELCERLRSQTDIPEYIRLMAEFHQVFLRKASPLGISGDDQR